MKRLIEKSKHEKVCSCRNFFHSAFRFAGNLFFYHINRFYVEHAFQPITVAITEPLFVGIQEQYRNPEYKFTVSSGKNI